VNAAKRVAASFDLSPEAIAAECTACKGVGLPLHGEAPCAVCRGRGGWSFLSPVYGMAVTLETASQVRAAIAASGIPGEVRGRGRSWEIELPTDEDALAFEPIATVGGFRTGYGAWILRPGYQDKGDWNDRTSRWHY
jgi:hypothetical protein